MLDVESFCQFDFSKYEYSQNTKFTCSLTSTIDNNNNNNDKIQNEKDVINNKGIIMNMLYEMINNQDGFNNVVHKLKKISESNTFVTAFYYDFIINIPVNQAHDEWNANWDAECCKNYFINKLARLVSQQSFQLVIDFIHMHYKEMLIVDAMKQLVIFEKGNDTNNTFHYYIILITMMEKQNNIVEITIEHLYHSTKNKALIQCE